MIRLFAPDETNFDHNEIILSPHRCHVEEEENGEFELEYESLPDPRITEGSIIQAPTPRGLQLFRVYRPTHTLRKTKVQARHITYDLMDNFLEDVRPTATSGSGALSAILGGTLYPHRFTGMSTVANISTAYYVRRNPIQALIGIDSCLVSRWGGFIKRDNFEIRHIPAGRDLGYEIRYGKNLRGIEVEIDDSTVVTKLMPTWVDEETNQVQLLPEKYIESPIIGLYPHPKITEYRVEVPESITDAESYVRQKAEEQFSIGNVDKPIINYSIDFIALRDLPEYKDFVWLEEIDLYDVVNVYVEKMGIAIESSVISYQYDAVKKRFIEIEIGNFTNSLAKNTAQTIREIEQRIDAKAEELLARQAEATRKITGVTGGNVLMRFDQLGRPYETLWMDTDDVATAKNVVRINQNGIGFSKNGIDGPYNVAITNDGHIVADFIDLGTLNAAIIKAGVLADASGKNYLNMESGAFNLANKIWYNPTTNQFRIDAALLVDEISGTDLKLAGKNITLDGNTTVLGSFSVPGSSLFGTINASIVNVEQLNASNLNRGTVGTSVSNTSGSMMNGYRSANMYGSATGFNANSGTFNFNYGNNALEVQGRINAFPSGNNHALELNGLSLNTGSGSASFKVWSGYNQIDGSQPLRINSQLQVESTLRLRGKDLSLGADGFVKWG